MTMELDDSQVKELLNAVVKNMTNAQPALQKIGRVVVAGVQDNFAEGGAYSSPDNLIGGSKRWEPLSQTTIKIKERQGKKGPHQILLDSGTLRDSVTEKADKDSVVIGTNMEYAALQHFGAKKGQFGIHNVLFKAHLRNIAGKKVNVRSHTRKVKLPWGDIPARPFMTIHPTTLEDMVEILASFITGEK
jgi:phage gpG-like protein